jgi:hypothetical protein
MSLVNVPGGEGFDKIVPPLSHRPRPVILVLGGIIRILRSTFDGIVEALETALTMNPITHLFLRYF